MIGSLPSDRNVLYGTSALGMAATRIEERVACAMGSPSTPPIFEPSKSIQYGGVLLLLPFLIELGLLSFRSHYQDRKGYYSLTDLIIVLAFVFLLRIKSVEQTKLYNPGELGRLIGRDRIPEVKKLREMVREITDQHKCVEWNRELSCLWLSEETPELYYTDGHAQVYHGYLANLGKKHISRQRLCLPAMMEFWINSGDRGLPYFFITAQVNEKMIEMLRDHIVPELLTLHKPTVEQHAHMTNNPDYPLFTLVFDREGYSPAFFAFLWHKYRIAVLTYKKNVNDNWDEKVFKPIQVKGHFGKQTDMLLAEERSTLNGCQLREVRRLCKDGHQTSIITTNNILTVTQVAEHMFGRWVQENFFRYLRQDYSLDSIVRYAVDRIDDNMMVVNREYSNINYKIKKEREKLSRLKAILSDHQTNSPINKEHYTSMAETDEKITAWTEKHLEMTKRIKEKQEEINTLTALRKGIPYKIKLSQMPSESRYNKLHQESKHLMNIIKMICYRAETAFANLLSLHYKKAEDEIRMLSKACFNLTVDIQPDEEKRILNINLYKLSNSRSQRAIEKIIEQINETKTVFPQTDMVMRFNFATG